MSLKQRLIEQITLEGPMSVADYMSSCLLDPVDGYYTRHVRLGADGDFITAPLVSQMFGEMIGVWVAQTWLAMNSPPAFRLVEIGGGDGALMSDILRVADHVPGLREAIQVVMVEPSPRLRAQQAQTIAGALFLTDVNAISIDLPVIIVANEVLDCLPARQYVRTEEGWAERAVGIIDGDLAFGLVETDYTPAAQAEPGQIIEVSRAQQQFAANLAAVIKSATGAVLLLDYGRAVAGPGDTLQALSLHEKRHPLEAPGKHDLTIWADFEAIANVLSTHVKLSDIKTQGEFLGRAGISARLAALSEKNPDHADKLQRQYERLTSASEMGELFKVMAFAYPASLPLFALED
ncbi:class I SAM-dependent methyltransferase [Asticcacaulis sp. AC402]|uniref:class I SAM-dependent methyltransferase n=1 Tax=Asticcacaulis sp. AC402 TaxID=1282361 RepID=UPI0003C403F6|nr:SAM-dependent methyltransferase [Asticcacaulis sp. AC402]ESQ74753.1 hypothetical protein ABAC402_12675 [Asticcacaulis sp. AC402]